FVQLVQNEMFSKRYDDRTNYCFMEYERAVATNKQMILLFADGVHPQDLIPEEDALFDLDRWYQFVRGADCIDLESTRMAEHSSNIAMCHDKLKKRLVEQVQAFRSNLWESVPGDLE